MAWSRSRVQIEDPRPNSLSLARAIASSMSRTLTNGKNGIIENILGMSAHNDTEFHKIDELWSNPRVISFDSHLAVVESNNNFWQLLIGLIWDSIHVQRMDRVLFCANFMIDYAGVKFEDEWVGCLTGWMKDLTARFGHCDVDWYEFAGLNYKFNSTTNMVAIAVQISKKE